METKKKKSISQRGDFIFHCALLIWPLLQFAVFYIGVNINSLAMAFKGDNGLTFEHFKFLFSNAMLPSVLKSVRTSVLFYVVNTVISLPLALLFAYYIFKKLWGAKLFRMFLFLPSIVSAMVMVVLFHKFTDVALGDILEDLFGIRPSFLPLINSTKYSSYATILFFYIWTNFGTTTLIYSNKMSELSPEVLEAAQLDGATSSQEFFRIVLPFAYPTVSTFVVTGVATIFTNQYNLFSFYGSSIGFDPGTLGYYFFANIQDVTGKADWNNVIFNRYAALSIVVTLFLVPITLGVRRALEKFGPSEE